MLPCDLTFQSNQSGALKHGVLALHDNTSKLQMPELDVKQPQIKGNGSPPTKEFCLMAMISAIECREQWSKTFFPVPGVILHTHSEELFHVYVRVWVCLQDIKGLHDSKPITVLLQDLLLNGSVCFVWMFRRRPSVKQHVRTKEIRQRHSKVCSGENRWT